nr:hypothetical protein [Mucilaginibacter sp. FT3.2]
MAGIMIDEPGHFFVVTILMKWLFGVIKYWCGLAVGFYSNNFVGVNYT